MLSINPLIKEEIRNGTCKFHPVTTGSLVLSDDDFWEGGVEIEDSICPGTEFQYGGGIVGKCNITLNNSDGRFNGYSFEGREFTLKIRCSTEYFTDEIRKGIYTVNSAEYSDRLVHLECYDNMYKLDRVFECERKDFPMNILSLFTLACGQAGVNASVDGNLGRMSSLPTIHVNYPPPIGVTCKQIAIWVAQLCGGYIKAKSDGSILMKPYNTHDNVSIKNVFSKHYSRKTYTYGIAHVYLKKYNEDYSILYPFDEEFIPEIEAVSDEDLESLTEKEVDTSYTLITGPGGGNPIEIKDNPLVERTNAAYIALKLPLEIGGIATTAANVVCLSDPTIEAGDLVSVTDTVGGGSFSAFATTVIFSTGGAQTIIAASNGESSDAAKSNSKAMNLYTTSANRSTQIENQIARPYDEFASYEKDDYVVYDNVFYKALEDIEGVGDEGEDGGDEPESDDDAYTLLGAEDSSGESGDGEAEEGNKFDPTKWERIIVTDELGFGLIKEIARPYDSSKTYAQGDYISYRGKFYKCNEDDVSGEFDESYWDNIILSDEFDKLIDEIASPYDATKTYEFRDYVSYNGKFYKCMNTSAPGEFNPSNWERVIIADEINKSPFNDSYNPNVAYFRNDVVIQDGYFYVCRSDNVTGPFSDSYWTRVDFGSLIVSIKYWVGTSEQFNAIPSRFRGSDKMYFIYENYEYEEEPPWE